MKHTSEKFAVQKIMPLAPAFRGTDQMAVVDPKLRVYGVEGLRVVDASIMPTLITGHTNPATIMIGENAADLIKTADSLSGSLE